MFAEVASCIRDPEQSGTEMRCHYERIREEAALALCTLETRISQAKEANENILLARDIHVYLAQAGTLTCLGIILNGILAATELENERELQAEYNVLFEYMETVAESSQVFRPLGASYMPMCIASAHAMTKNLARRRRAEELLEDFQSDFGERGYVKQSEWLERKVSVLRSRSERRREQERTLWM